MPVSFVTQAVDCEDCRAGLCEGLTPDDPLSEIEEDDGIAYGGVAADLDAVGHVFLNARPCHPVRGFALGSESDSDGSFEVGEEGFRWTFRGDE